MAIDRRRYPRNWKAIAASIRARAGDRCEVCGIENGAPIPRRPPLPGFEIDPALIPRNRRVVLTVAHLDHTPENCDPANLKAMCQRCHLAYDHSYHLQEMRKTLEAKRLAASPRDLFSLNLDQTKLFDD